ncbi:MAG: helix-turn-helix domain-containing protein [Rikenellaceae bacterium]
MRFYSIIKERRSLLRLTQQDLADYSGLSLRVIKSIESGKGNPSVSTLTKIADTLGLELILKVKEINK